MESQEQCNRMKQLCIDNGLPIWSGPIAFLFREKKRFEFSKEDNEFWVTFTQEQEIQITEQEFIELLKTTI